jgi:predicted porin
LTPATSLLAFSGRSGRRRDNRSVAGPFSGGGRVILNLKVRAEVTLVGAAALLSLLCDADAADLPMQTLPPASSPSCFASFADYFLASAQECPLTWNGITLYGTFDFGGGYQTHGVPFNGVYPNGVEELISKNSNSRRYVLIPNGLGQSNVGVKGDEPIAGDWSLVFNLQNGFDPYTLQRANGPKSMVQNNTTPLDYQTANGDSSRAGQLFNTVANAGLSHPIYGTLTAGRQDSLILDGLGAYDPMGAAPAFSVIGTSNTVAGAGDTEDARYNTSVQYRVNIGTFRLAGLYQFGGYDQGNGSNGAIDVQVGGDFGGFSFDAVGSKVRDAVSLSNFGESPLPSGVSVNDLKATLSDNTSGVIMLRYTYGALKLYGGFEYILFRNPTDAYPQGFTTLGVYNVLPGYVTATAYKNNKVLRIFWTGVKVAVRDDIDVAGAYYHYYQNDYNTSACTDGGLSASNCAGTLNALSAMIEYRPAKRIDLYAGVMWSQVTGGLASGYLLYHENFGPTAGLRFQF